jgi:hypothetical protein
MLSFQQVARAEAPPSVPAKTAPAKAAPVKAAPVKAAPVKAAPKKSAQQERFDAAAHKLGSGDPATVQNGIDALVLEGGPLAERALTERVAAGLPPSLVEPALRGLVALKAKRSVPVVIELLEHRRALVRSEALLALSQLDARKPSPLQATFVAALNDPASEVSRAAAQGLGKIGTKTALPALWSAYDRGVTPALASIAELAGPESIDTLLTRVQASGGIELIGAALDRILARNALPSTAQVKLVRALAATKSDGARQYLLGWLDRIKLQGNAQVKQELFGALKALSTPESPAAQPAAASPPPEVAIKAPTTATKAGAR